MTSAWLSLYRSTSSGETTIASTAAPAPYNLLYIRPIRSSESAPDFMMRRVQVAVRPHFASHGGAKEDDLLRLCDLDDAPDDIVQCALRDVRQLRSSSVHRTFSSSYAVLRPSRIRMGLVIIVPTLPALTSSSSSRSPLLPVVFEEPVPQPSVVGLGRFRMACLISGMVVMASSHSSDTFHQSSARLDSGLLDQAVGFFEGVSGSDATQQVRQLLLSHLPKSSRISSSCPISRYSATFPRMSSKVPTFNGL